MDKISTVFSILIADDDFMLIFWGILSAIDLFVDFFFPLSGIFSEEGLIEIDKKFKDIKSDYILFGLISVTFILISMRMIFPPLNTWAITNYGRVFYPIGAYFFAAYGIYQASFALWKGVYPRGKLLSFHHAEKTIIRKYAKYQIAYSVFIFTASVLFFFATSKKIQ